MDVIVLYLLFLQLFTSFRDVFSTEQEFTISVDPGREQCFFQTVKVGQILDIEYQVIDGGHGDLDINFKVFTPSSRVLLADFKKTDAAHRKEASEFGDYKMCFDNSFSHISTKVIYFEMIIEDDDDDDEDEEKLTPKKSELDDVYPVGVDDIEEAVNRMKNNLNKVKHIQDQLRAFEARDRNIQEHNFYQVNTWSMTQIVIMLVVGAIQVLMVRSLFDDRSRVHKIWKLKSLGYIFFPFSNV
uniref:GOLD domain-containing protein n=1 Tax=Strigamia maritima TaxID=126957 RepID=T1JJH8_STRMM